MNVQHGNMAVAPGWLVVFLTGHKPTRTERVDVVFFDSETTTSKPAPVTFDEHLASLSTLSDLLAASRRLHSGFDQYLLRARQARYQDYLREVRKGNMSRLTAERLRCRLTQGELAETAGMKQPNISRWEQPGTSMSVRTAKRLAKALGLEDYRVLLP